MRLFSPSSTKPRSSSIKTIQGEFFRSQLLLILLLAVFLGVFGALMNVKFENHKRDVNIRNIAKTIAQTPNVRKIKTNTPEENRQLCAYLDSLVSSLEEINVASIVNEDSIRVYHSKPELIGTTYASTLPKYDPARYTYSITATGPTGRQRRAYAPIYDEKGEYVGFVIVLILMKNIHIEILQVLSIFLLATLVALLIDLMISSRLSKKLKRSLMGYEPDVFTAMYRMRDNILEALEEGVLAVNKDGKVLFMNKTALRMFNLQDIKRIEGRDVAELHTPILAKTIQKGVKETNVHLKEVDVVLDCVPIIEDGEQVGGVAILHDRAEYTKLMEDLSGVRYLVDSMRANNHDFTNKLHVILGLIQMGMYDQAISYIQNVTIVQRETISQIIKKVHEPSVAALLLGKIARASELNIRFKLRENSEYNPTDVNVPPEALVTIVGNLLDNAFDAMNSNSSKEKELLFGIYSSPGALLISVDDTGSGISVVPIEKIFENGYSTKGAERGIGLFHVKNLIDALGGKISVDSQEGVGTSFTVSVKKGEKDV